MEVFANNANLRLNNTNLRLNLGESAIIGVLCLQILNIGDYSLIEIILQEPIIIKALCPADIYEIFAMDNGVAFSRSCFLWHFFIFMALPGQFPPEEDSPPPRAKLRPWLQVFDLGATYTPAMVQAQIRAVNDVLSQTDSAPDLNASWLLWDPKNTYTSF